MLWKHAFVIPAADWNDFRCISCITHKALIKDTTEDTQTSRWMAIMTPCTRTLSNNAEVLVSVVFVLCKAYYNIHRIRWVFKKSSYALHGILSDAANRETYNQSGF